MTEIKITDTETGETKNFDTDGFLLLYLNKEKIQMQGNMDIKALYPILTRIALEKLSK